MNEKSSSERLKKIAKVFAEYSIVTALTIIAYHFTRKDGIEFRGNTSYGGELCVFALPLLYAWAKSICKDFMKGGVFREFKHESDD